ncbi:type II toxin-antitoxin system Phd/YefM family antitoxin [Rhodococcus sp. IEGM 1343]|uniref:type II toxin-antitoxin system Phd/YefM family antitoxin n=1 Tax=Rhodococcus sp. IEGM 1343 TaxID=3082224 RepID=UPI00295546D7|nr:type II toxin-antitoxin system Phd/YefM family antitoxin [Rhodococcus sp. IEGM 1343]MDV8058235.1 type II toxin-antitoxin system Phd/YefM family antitoxin [Rhodococcus sp. IEGM 1343]
MNIDSSNFVSVTDFGQNCSRLVAEATGGRTFLVMKNNKPAAAVVSPADFDRLQRIDEREQDLRLLSLAVVRSVTDSGERHDLDDVAAEFGVDLSAEDDSEN